MRRSHLLLAPATPSHCRIWMSLPQGADARNCADRAVKRFPALRSSDPQPLIIASAEDGLATYASAISALEELQKKMSATGSSQDLTSVIGAMRNARASETELDSSKNLEEAVRRNGDALAALRRISRESAESSILIDRAARHLNAGISKLSLTHILIANAERIDRPSLKIFARACLLASNDTAPIWIWTVAAQRPTSLSQTLDDWSELPVHARHGILNAIKTVLVPVEADFPIDHETLFVPANMQEPDYGIGGATAQLANLNYDRCAQWIADRPDPDVDTSRLAALIMVNLGLPEAAVDTLSHAIEQCPDASLQ